MPPSAHLEEIQEGKEKGRQGQKSKQTQRRYLKSSIPAIQALSLGAVANLRRRKEKRITVASGSRTAAAGAARHLFLVEKELALRAL